MHLKNFTTTGLSLILISTIVANDTYTVQAQSRFGNCVRPCGSRYKGSHIGSGQRAVIEKIEGLIKLGQATVDDYLILGDAYRLEKNYDLAQQRLSQGLEIAKQNGDRQGQAIALSGLGQVFTETGRLEDASSNLTAAKNIYSTLGNQQGINLVDWQLRNVIIQQRLINPSRIQTAPSQLRIQQ